MLEIRQMEKDLLIASAQDLLEKMDKDIVAESIKQMAFGWILSNGKEVQVQVNITRNEDDFLDPFQDEETINALSR